MYYVFNLQSMNINNKSKKPHRSTLYQVKQNELMGRDYGFSIHKARP